MVSVVDLFLSIQLILYTTQYTTQSTTRYTTRYMSRISYTVYRIPYKLGIRRKLTGIRRVVCPTLFDTDI
jgi:hypothetical protein